jgi:hypothetical protein
MIGFQQDYTSHSDFDLDQAIEDFRFMTEWYGNKASNYEDYIKCAVQAQFDNPTTISAGFYLSCIESLKTAIGGYQMRMEELPSFQTLWWEDSVWKKE